MTKVILAATAIVPLIPYLMTLKDTAEVSDALDLFLHRIKWKGFDWKTGTAKFDVEFKYINPTSKSLTLDYIYTKIKLFDKEGPTLIVGSAQMNKEIAPKQKGIINMPIETPNLYVELGSYANTIIKNFPPKSMWVQYKIDVNGLPQVAIEEKITL